MNSAASWTPSMYRFTAADRAFFDHTQPHLGVSALGWYPLAVIHRALDALTHGTTADERDAIAVKGGEATVRGMVRGPQGIVFALFMTPGRYGHATSSCHPTTFRRRPGHLP